MRRKGQVAIVPAVAYGGLIAYMVARYSPIVHPIGRLLGDNKLHENATGVHQSLLVSGPVLVAFSAGLYVIIFRFAWLTELRRKLRISRSSLRWFMVGLIGIIGLIGLTRYGDYVDETRDVEIFRLVREHGIGVYLEGSVGGSSAVIELWVRRLHPPFQYIYAAGVARLLDLPHRVSSYRLIFFGTYLAGLSVILLLGERRRVDPLFLDCWVVVPMTFSYFRNYVLLRCALEFFAMVGVTTFVFLLYLINERRLKAGPLALAGLLGASVLAVFSKSTSLVAIFALFLAFSTVVVLVASGFRLNESTAVKRATLIIPVITLLTRSEFEGGQDQKGPDPIWRSTPGRSPCDVRFCGTTQSSTSRQEACRCGGPSTGNDACRSEMAFG